MRVPVTNETFEWLSKALTQANGEAVTFVTIKDDTRLTVTLPAYPYQQRIRGDGFPIRIGVE
jgi:hypothetical protein